MLERPDLVPLVMAMGDKMLTMSQHLSRLAERTRVDRTRNLIDAHHDLTALRARVAELVEQNDNLWALVAALRATLADRDNALANYRREFREMLRNDEEE